MCISIKITYKNINVIAMLWIVCKIGYCAEFNTAGALIQENYGADCRKYDPPCPKIYNSAKAYKCELISYPDIR